MDNFCVVIPHRNRKEQLNNCLIKLEEYFKKNNWSNYSIVVSHQKDEDSYFNLSLGFNCGAMFALSFFKDKISHFIFQGVDAIPVSVIDYATPQNVVHLMGIGICKILRDDFIKTYGYDTNHFGWGYEDCTFYDRWDTLKLKYIDPYPNGGNYNSTEWIQSPNVLDDKKFYSLWYNENTTKRNSKIVEHFRALSTDDRIRYMEAFGISQINIEKIKLINRAKNVYHITYQSNNYV